MKIIDAIVSKFKWLLLKRIELCERTRQREQEKWKKFCLDNYSAYHNADKLTHDQMLEVFWKMLEKERYNTSSFNGGTNFFEPYNQSVDWGDSGAEEFIMDLEKIFGLKIFSTFGMYITDDEYGCLKTFGELADLVIKKAEEKKLKEGQDKEEVR